MGADVIVTVRMPASLVTALKSRIETDHYSDLSEQIRSVVRKGCFRYTNPISNEVKELKSQLKAELLKEQETERTEHLLASLRNLLRGEAE